MHNFRTGVALAALMITALAAHADPTCAGFADLLVLQAKMLKTATEGTARSVENGLKPLTTPEQIAKWTEDLKDTAKEVKARCAQ